MPTTSGSLEASFEVEEGLGEDLLGWEGSQDLAEEADLNLADWGGFGLAAVLDLVAGSEGFGELCAVGGDVGGEFG